jgi:hypothetical protein
MYVCMYVDRKAVKRREGVEWGRKG